MFGASHSSLNKAFTPEQPLETMNSLRPLFTVAKVLGTFPLSCDKDGSLVFSWWRLRTLWCLLIAASKLFILLSQMVNMAHDMPLTSGDIAAYLLNFIFFLHASLVTLIVLWQARELPMLFDYLRVSEAKLQHYRPSRGDGLVATCWTITFVHLAMALTNSALFVSSVAFRNTSGGLRSFVEHLSQAYNVDKIMPWWMGAVMALLVELFCHCAWSFPDMVLILLSLVIRRFYVRFNRLVERIDTSRIPQSKLEEFRRDHVIISNMVQRIDNVIAQQTLVAVMGDVGFIFSRLYLGLSDIYNSPSLVVRLEGGFSFAYVLGRTMFTALCAARLHEEAHKALRHVKMWPSGLSIYCECTTGRLIVINRFIKQLQHPPIGFTGSGYFIVDKSFMTRLVSALITYEVVILQLSAA